MATWLWNSLASLSVMELLEKEVVVIAIDTPLSLWLPPDDGSGMSSGKVTMPIFEQAFVQYGVCSLAAKFSMPFPTQFMLAGCSAPRPGSPQSLKNRKDSEKLIESRRKTSLCSCAAGVEGLALINSSGRAPSYFTLIFSDRGTILSGAERK
ncbi:hypothetical protein DPX16_14599 [Anabarilius grahami]|uniref:Uncharacterized protein n=1 Tax=Anabarilius grahami TaxID=495550 RepID=A0A3N0YZH5_ANAGA|nr:hypothetical protein DPX16_14599 [Anabarilius grahami]